MHVRHFAIASFLLMLNFLVTFVSAEEPTQIGYERWTHTTLNSGTEFSLHPESYYGEFADKLKLFGRPTQKASKRIIDIEMTYHPDIKEYLMDAVWIENEGDFETDSWMLYDLTEEEVHQLAKIPQTVILDLESYSNYFSLDPKNPARYAVILRKNPEDFKSRVFTEAKWSEIQPYIADRENWRAIDIDVLQAEGEYVNMPSEYDADEMNRYHAVFVQNDVPKNQKSTIYSTGNESHINLYANNGFQLIDFEDRMGFYQHYHTDQTYLMIYVVEGESFNFFTHMSENVFEAAMYGLMFFLDAEHEQRCIDMEGWLHHPQFNPKGRMGVFLDN